MLVLHVVSLTGSRYVGLRYMCSVSNRTPRPAANTQIHSDSTLVNTGPCIFPCHPPTCDTTFGGQSEGSPRCCEVNGA